MTTNELIQKMFNGEVKYKASLLINNKIVPNTSIEKIDISKPIIDSQKNYFYIGTFVSDKITPKLRNINDVDIKSGYDVDLKIQILDSEDVVDVGDFIVDELTEDYYKNFSFPCLDSAVNLKTPLDYSPCFDESGKTTVDNLLEWICNYYGLELESYPTINGDIEIGTYDSTVSGKQWLSYIAEIKGCNLKIKGKNKLKFIPIKPNTTKSKNEIYTDLNEWESGIYNSTGVKASNDQAIRTTELVEINNNSTKKYIYIRNEKNQANSSYYMTIATFDKNRNFIRFINNLSNGTSVTFTNTEKYIGVSILSSSTIVNKYLVTQDDKTITTESGLSIELNQNLDYDYYEYLFSTNKLRFMITSESQWSSEIPDYYETPIAKYQIRVGKTKSWEVKEKYKISKVSYYDATRDYTFGTDTGNTLYIRQDNPFIKDEITVFNIYNAVKNTEYYSLTNECPAILLSEAGDCIDYFDGTNHYYSLYNAEITYQISAMEKNSVSIPSSQQEKTTNTFDKDDKTNLKVVKSEIDLVNASIKLQASEITTVKESVTNVSNKIDETESSLNQTIQNTKDSLTQTIQDTEDSLNQNIQETENALNQNIQDTANQINQDVINKLKDYAKVEDLDDYVTTEKLESTIDLTTEGILQSVTQEITTTKSEISQEIETSITQSENKTNQNISTAISNSESKTNQNITNAIATSENKTNQAINSAVSTSENKLNQTINNTKNELNQTIQNTEDTLNGNIDSAISQSENKLNQNINNAVDDLEQQITTTLTQYVTTQTFNSTLELQSDSILQSVSEDIETVENNISITTGTMIDNLGSQFNEALEDYATTTMVTNIKNSVENEITSTQQSINVINQVLEDGVTKVDTKTGFTFDSTGLTIAKTGADTKTNINENGMIIYSSTGSTDEAMLTVNSEGVIGENMTVRTYLTVGSHSRFEDYEDGTGCFYIE